MKQLNGALQHKTFDWCFKRLNGDSLNVNEISIFQHGLVGEGLYKGFSRILDHFVTPSTTNPKRERERERRRGFGGLWVPVFKEVNHTP